ncbi:MAG: hypothetical protein ABSG95_04090 [Solirubrobacteraceae bacterium]|jgi:hypothetical protein
MSVPDPLPPARRQAHVPTPPSERGPWLLACAIGVVGVVVFVAALSGAVGRAAPVTPPKELLLAPTPTPGPAAAASALAGLAGRAGAPRSAIDAGTEGRAPIVAQPSSRQQSLDARRFLDQTESHISRRWMEGFYPIYATAQATFGVNWLLLASIHMQESAFSTARGTYEGLNFAHCCGGPMQFNVTNGPVSTWELVSDSYIYGRRPSSYDHRTSEHPSIYDDFDSIMAAAHLLSADGAEYALNGAAWDAAYDYYGHDATGVSYADQVLARAISWSQHGFCINCALPGAMVEAVHAAYGAPVLAALRSRPPEATARSAARLSAGRRTAAT